MVSVADVKAYVGSTDPEYDDLLANCLAEATELVEKYITRVYWDAITQAYLHDAAYVPDVILDRAFLEVAADLFNRRNAPNGIQNAQFALEGATPMRINRDPMAPAYPLLRRYVLPW